MGTLKLLRSQNAQSVSTPCGWVTPSSLTPPKVLTVADKIWVVQVLVSKISEPLHSSSVPVLEVLANSLPTASVSGVRTINKDQQFADPQLQALKGKMDGRSQVSRCKVCVKSL